MSSSSTPTITAWVRNAEGKSPQVYAGKSADIATTIGVLRKKDYTK